MADLITIDQFEARTGRTLTASQFTQAQALITDASALVADLVNDATITGAWTDATVPASIVPVVVGMVRRGIDNPHGYSGESVGTYSYAGASQTGVFASRDEARAIRRAAGTSGIASLNLDSHLPARSHISWLDGAL